MNIYVFSIALLLLFIAKVNLQNVSTQKKWGNDLELKHVPRIHSTVKTFSYRITGLERSKNSPKAKECRNVAENHLQEIELDGRTSIVDCIKNSRKLDQAETCAQRVYSRIYRDCEEILRIAERCIANA